MTLDALARADVPRDPIALGDGPLRLDTDSGDVEVVAGSGPPRLEVRAVGGLFGDGQVDVDRGPGGSVSVDAGCGFPSLAFSCESSLRAVVAPGTRVEVSTGSGEVTVTGVRGGVIAESGSGDVALRGVGGERVSVDTGSGEITGTGIAADALRAETGSGDLDLTLSRAPRSAVLDTGSGEVALSVPDVGYRVAVDTGSGDERIDVRQDPAATRRIDVETGSGDVSVLPVGR